MAKILNISLKYNNIFIILLFFLTIKLSVSDDISDDISDSDDEQELIPENSDLAGNAEPGNDIGSDYITDSIINSTNGTNRTDDKKTKSSGGLSTGALLGILIPSIALILGAILAALLCTKCSNTPPPMQAGPVIADNIIPTSSAVDIIQTTQTTPSVVAQYPSELVLSLPQPQPQIITQPQFVVQNIPIKAGVAPMPIVNRVFQPLVLAPKQQVVTQISQTQIPQVMSSSSIVNVSQSVQPEPTQLEVTESYIGESQVVADTKVLPDIHTSQVSANQVMAPQALPPVLKQSQVLPPQVLPTINEGNVSTSMAQPNEFPINYVQNALNNNSYVISNPKEKLPYITKVNEELPVNYINQGSTNNNSNNNIFLITKKIK